MDRHQIGFAIDDLDGFPETSIEQFAHCRNACRSRRSPVVSDLNECPYVCFGLVLSQLP
jgi:hypothetical protein